MKIKQVFDLCICGVLALLILQSCGINDGIILSKQVYILSTVNDVPVTKDKEVGIVGGMITLYKNENIERKMNHRMQDGSDQQNVYEGTYEINGNELAIEFKDSTGYRWSPPKGKLDGDTLIFYNPCVNCFGPAHEEVYIRH
ncbi:MAG: hypothetical protein WEA58_06365 [Balneolaceae bacterium]